MAGTSTKVMFFIVAASVIAASGVTPLIHATTTPPTEPPPVHYDIGLDIKQDEVEAITVRATVTVGGDGIVDFEPPAQQPTEVHAESGSLDTSIGKRWRVSGAPGARIALTWRSPRPQRLLTVDQPAWQRVIGQPGKVFAFNGVLLAIPKVPSTRLVTTTLSLPAGWHGATGATDGSTTVETLPSTSFIASRDLQTVTRPIGTTHTLRVAASGLQAPDVESIATRLAAATSTDTKDVTLNLLVFHAGDGGTGYSVAGPAATLLLSRYDPSNPWLFGLVGDLSSSDDAAGQAAHAWFTRGVTGYRVAMAFRAEGLFDNVSLARHIDQTLDAYGGSPLRRASNARIAVDYDRIREMHDLPAARGELFAWLVDSQIRKATQGRKRLLDALRRMDGSSPDPGPALIAAVAAEGGGDIAPLYQRYIVDGQLLQLPPDTLGPCFAVGTVAYDYGWQVQHVFAKPPTLCVGADSSATGNVGADSSAKSQQGGDEASSHRR
jgi:hypothetical protein